MRESFGGRERRRGPLVPPESREYGGGNGGSGELFRRPGGAAERKKMGKWKRGRGLLIGRKMEGDHGLKRRIEEQGRHGLLPVEVARDLGPGRR